MPSSDGWFAILELIKSYSAPDPRSGRHVHRFLFELELALGDVPAVRLARTAWRTLERALVEDPNADVERERQLCLEALRLAIDAEPEVRNGLTPSPNGQ